MRSLLRASCSRSASLLAAPRFVRASSTRTIRVTPPLAIAAAPSLAAMSSGITVAVKGDPLQGKLGDCPFCHKVLLALNIKGLAYDMELIDLNYKPQWLMEASGGKVPVLKAPSENIVIPDSEAIVDYLQSKYPDPPMKTSAPVDIHSKVFPAFVQCLKSGPEELEQKKAALMEALQPINEYLSQPGKGPLFGGMAIDASDAEFAPKLYHIVVALPHFKGFMLPLHQSALWRYMAYIQTLQAWKMCEYGPDEIIAGWRAHGVGS